MDSIFTAQFIKLKKTLLTSQKPHVYTQPRDKKEKMYLLNSCVMLLGTQKQLKTLPAIEAWKHYSLIVITSTLKSSQKKQITCTSPQNETKLHKVNNLYNRTRTVKNFTHCKYM